MKEKAKMAEDEKDERTDNIPWPGPNSHSERTHTEKRSVGGPLLKVWPYVLIDRLTLANPIAEAPKNC